MNHARLGHHDGMNLMAPANDRPPLSPIKKAGRMSSFSFFIGRLTRFMLAATVVR